MGLTLTVAVLAFMTDTLGEGIGIAVLPIIIQNLTAISSFAVGGTALLIAVSVVLDVIKKIEAQLSIREY